MLRADHDHVHGTIVRGHRVASGAAADPRFPQGTIAPQLPFFRNAVDGFDDFLGGPAHPGTINVALEGQTVLPGKTEIVLRDIRWTAHFPGETFFLTRASLDYPRGIAPAYIYMPDPRTKPDHHQDRGVVELIARHLEGIRYGQRVRVGYRRGALRLTPAG